MMRLGITVSTAGVLLFAVACSDDTGTPNPGTGTGGGSGTATTAGTSSGGSASGSAAGGVAGTTTAGASTGGTGTAGSGGGTTTAGTAGAGGSGGGSAGSGGSGGGSGGSGGGTGGGTGGGGACDATTGKALQFKGGTNDLVAGDLGDDLMGGNSARTVELWAHFTSVNSWKGEGTVIELGRKTNTNNQVFGIDMADTGRTNATAGKFDPYTNGIGDNDGATAMIPIVTWAHLAWGYDGAGHFQFVVNGTKVTLSSPGTGSGMLATTKGIVTLGGSQGFGYEGWDGVMDEVRVWSVFRAEADIKRDMKIKLKGTETGLVAYYNLDEGTGETADDIKKTPAHQLKFCTASGGACPVANAAKPMWVASDIPGPFTCAP